jgi:hypothetical protein
LHLKIYHKGISTITNSGYDFQTNHYDFQTFYARNDFGLVPVIRL